MGNVLLPGRKAWPAHLSMRHSGLWPALAANRIPSCCWLPNCLPLLLLAAYFPAGTFSAHAGKERVNERIWAPGLTHCTFALGSFDLVLAKPLRERSLPDRVQTDLRKVCHARFTRHGTRECISSSVQFRLLRWRLTPRSLAAEHAWWTRLWGQAGPGTATG